MKKEQIIRKLTDRCNILANLNNKDNSMETKGSFDIMSEIISTQDNKNFSNKCDIDDIVINKLNKALCKVTADVPKQIDNHGNRSKIIKSLKRDKAKAHAKKQRKQNARINYYHLG